MKNLIATIQAHGGLERMKRDPINVDRPSPSIMPLTIAFRGEGPNGQAMISVGHWFTRDGDRMGDPELEVELPDKGWRDSSLWVPASITHHPVGVKRTAVFVDSEGKVVVRPTLVRDLRSFMADWDDSIGGQGFLTQYLKQSARERSEGYAALGDEPDLELRFTPFLTLSADVPADEREASRARPSPRVAGDEGKGWEDE